MVCAMGFGVAVFAWSCVEIREAVMQAAPESLTPPGAVLRICRLIARLWRL